MTNDQQTVSRIISKCPQRFNERNESKKFLKFCFVTHDPLYLEKTPKIVDVVIEVSYSKGYHQFYSATRVK